MKLKVREIVGDILGLEADEIEDGLSRDTADGWDSLSHLRIITALEQEFQVTLSMDEIESANSVARLIAILEARAVNP